MSSVIAGLGTAEPRTRLDQSRYADAAVACCCRTAREERLLRGLYRRSGVASRGCAVLDDTEQSGNRDADLGVLFPPPAQPDGTSRGPGTAERMVMVDRAAPPLAERAVRAALEDAAIEPDAIGHLVTVCCTGFAAPGIDLALIAKLGLPADVTRTHVGFMGCHGAMNGLRVANALCQNSGRATLLVCVEVCTAHFHYGWHPDRVVANALFADGAAAAVLTPGSDTDNVAGTSGVATLGPTTTAVIPGSHDAMTWHIGDHGFEMTLSSVVPGLIEQHLPGLLPRWLDGRGTPPAAVGGWAIHPGGPRVIGATLRSLQLVSSLGDPSRGVLREHGNMSSPTVLFILDALRRHDVPKPWVGLAFGPGLTVEAATFL